MCACPSVRYIHRFVSQQPPNTGIWLFSGSSSRAQFCSHFDVLFHSSHYMIPALFWTAAQLALSRHIDADKPEINIDICC